MDTPLLLVGTFIMIGIYKITSPSGKIYIGQSINIQKRWKHYAELFNCKNQPKLYNSFLKYGVDKHKFDVIALCLAEDLNEIERYYQDLFSAIGKNGLNCLLTNTSTRSGCHSEETKKKMSVASSGRMLGRRVTNKTKQKLSDFNKGKKHTKNTILKMKIANQYNNAKKILNTETGEVYNSIQEASIVLNIKHKTLSAQLTGQNKNKHNLKKI